MSSGICADCGCWEEEHGDDDTMCSGCGEICTFNPDDELDDEPQDEVIDMTPQDDGEEDE